METGEKIKILREQNSMTLEELGHKVGVGKSTVRKWENEVNVMTKGGRIKLLREQKGITQEELAKLLNTTKQTVSKYENGIVTNIPSDKLDEIAKIFDTTPNYLMGWEDRSEGSPVDTACKIGKRINTRRRALKISAEELGKKIGKDRSTIYRYEKGDIENLPLDILEPIAKALETTPAYLMGWESNVEENSAKTANKLSEIFLDQELMETLSIYQSLDADKKKQVRDFIYFLNGRS